MGVGDGTAVDHLTPTDVPGLGSAVGAIAAGMYHTFRGEPGAGRVLVGEVSTVNDDRVDNRFLQPIGRFPAIEEDVPPRHLLTADYPRHCAHLLAAAAAR